MACCLMAELGARVIRIEPLEGENGRQNQKGIGVHRTMAGNEGLCLDLKTAEGQEIIHKLVANADILRPIYCTAMNGCGYLKEL